ncbi:sigma-70 family RNA polymerase sigma factor [bacterium]|nr:sigma-70 family RNA polymerase sigma factor [bacterium]
MKIPSNMTESQLMKSIETVVNRIAPKYTFNGYDVDDIKQESFLICLDALDRYDENRPLENFLSVHLSNRLKNFVRDNFYVSGTDEEKKKLLNPKSIGTEDIILDHSINFDPIELDEVNKIVDKILPSHFRSDYLKILNNIYVSKNRRNEITEAVLNILRENGYAQGKD